MACFPLDSAVSTVSVYPKPSTENRKVTGSTPVGATTRNPHYGAGFVVSGSGRSIADTPIL